MIKIPENCKFIFDMLKSCGFECFAVGGCVRDALMGNVPDDWDFTTNALPDEIISCFSDYKTVDVGKKYGTVCVVSDGVMFEITTYRVDGEYTDSRHPDSVSFAASIEDDLSRRDFTMNSLAYSPDKGIIDPFNGAVDIDNGCIRCTGDPKTRFSEDALRILRALRFSSRFGFEIEDDTKNAVFSCKDRLLSVHPNRLRKELSGILTGKYAKDILLKYGDVLSVIIPEIKPMFGLPQNNPHHVFDVWTHTAVAVGNVPCSEVLRLTMLFHDIGKPALKTTDENGIDHFKKHQHKSAVMAEEIMRRFAYPNDVVHDVTLLIKYHDERFRNLSPDIKRVLSVIGKSLFTELLKVSSADMMAQSDYKRAEKLEHLKAVEKEFKAIIQRGDCYSLQQLAVNGDDLVALGYKGKDIGTILNTLLKMVIKGNVENLRDSLLASVKGITLS